MSKTEQKKENVNVIENMITNLKLEIEAQQEQQNLVDNAKSFLTEINARIKNGRQALGFMAEYLTPEQLEIIDDLDVYVESSSSRGALSEVAQSAFDLLEKSPNGQMTNGELYETYTKIAGDNPLKYAAFNIKLRSLFSSMRLVRYEPQDAVNSRDHVIKINGVKSKN